jgi:hypothetical protein
MKPSLLAHLEIQRVLAMMLLLSSIVRPLEIPVLVLVEDVVQSIHVSVRSNSNAPGIANGDT